MKVHALLSWFDEDPGMLYRACHSHAEHCDSLTALDGRYALYPSSRDESSGEEYDAIMDACRDAGVPALVESPAAPWDGRWGGEVAKRAHLFRLAEQRSAPEDWYWVFDADFEVLEAFGDWRAILAETRALAGEIELRDPRARVQHPVLFRALRGLTVTEHHWHYHVPGGPVLWDYQSLETRRREEETGHMIIVRHCDTEREERRAAQRRRYYRQRDKQRIERDMDPARRARAVQVANEGRARLRSLFHDALASAGAQPTT